MRFCLKQTKSNKTKQKHLEEETDNTAYQNVWIAVVNLEDTVLNVYVGKEDLSNLILHMKTLDKGKPNSSWTNGMKLQWK